MEERILAGEKGKTCNDNVTGRITMQHGSGGSATGELIHSVFAEAFQSQIVDEMEDAAVLAGSGRIAMTTDSFVVTPLFFPGGDIGRLSICGTVNDLLSRGAVPKYLTCGFIIEEGAEISDLKTIAESMAKTAAEAGVTIVAGDTKVIEGSGGVYINTTGIGFIPLREDRLSNQELTARSSIEHKRPEQSQPKHSQSEQSKPNQAPYLNISARNAVPGDVIIVTGNLGDHHAALLSTRMAIETDITSDNAPLTEIVDSIRDLRIHTLRDVTRGGLATVLKELAESSKMKFVLKEELLPVNPKVRDFCGILGLDPLYMGNEGKMAVIVSAEDAEEALKRIRTSKYGEGAAIIGSVKQPENERETGALYAETAIGGLRTLSVLQGEGLPRIC